MLGLCEPLVASVGLDSFPVLCLNGTVFVVVFLQRFLFLKHLTVSVTQKAGRAVKIKSALGYYPGTALCIL